MTAYIPDYRTSISLALNQGKQRLAHFDNAMLESEILLAQVLARPRAWFYTWPEYTIEPEQLRHFFALVERRALGEPLAYITGQREFWSMNLEVNSATLIPRPETELLVELALQGIPTNAQWKIADLGTGSGAIALAIARERPLCTVIATDISPAALDVAQSNAYRLALPNVEFRLGEHADDWAAPLQGENFVMIVSNPPYINSLDPHLDELRFEPRSALVAGVDGLRDLRAVAMQVRERLAKGGHLLLEHGFDQRSQVMRLLGELGYQDIQNHRDSARHDRVVTAHTQS